MSRKRNNPTTGWRSYGPGKFDSMVDSFLWGEGDEETGDAEGPGYYILLVGDLVKVAEAGAEEQGDALNDDERSELAESKAVIMSEGSQGFVASTYYDTAAEARKAWKEIEAEVDGFYEDEPDS